MSIARELVINFSTGVGIIAAIALGVFLVACAASFCHDPHNDTPRWMKVLGALTIFLPTLTLLGFCMRIPA